MYLSDEKRTEIRECIEKYQSNFENNDNQCKGHDTEEIRKVSQIVFDARDGKEVFIPFKMKKVCLT